MTRFLLAVTFLITNGCTQPATNFEKEKQAILAIEKAQRDHHFKRNPEGIVNILSDDFLSVSKGKITTPSKKESMIRFTEYFGSCKFVKWDDVQEPVIRFSDDASVAYVAVKKDVIISLLTEEGIPLLDTTHFAWVSIYKKDIEGWKIDCIASTNQ